MVLGNKLICVAVDDVIQFLPLKAFFVNFCCVQSPHDTKRELISIMFLQHLCEYSF